MNKKIKKSCIKKKEKFSSRRKNLRGIDKDVEKLELLYVLGGIVKWCLH
jgi:hypothetical protein